MATRLKVGDKPYYVKVGALGFLTFVAGLLVFAVPDVITNPSDAPFFVITVAVALVITFLFVQLRTWGVAFGLLGGLAGLAFFAPDIPFHLSQTNSFFDFFGSLLILVALVLIFVGTIVSLVQKRRGTARTEGVPLEKAVLMATAGIIAVLAVVSTVLTVTGKSSVSAADRTGAELIQMKKTAFNPTSIAGQSGKTTKILLKNSDPFVHTFTIDKLGIDYTVGPGSEKLVEIKAPAVGDYEFYCKISGHEDMKGTLAVR